MHFTLGKSCSAYRDEKFLYLDLSVTCTKYIQFKTLKIVIMIKSIIM